MKRIISLLLALVLLIGMIPVSAQAATLDNGLAYEVYEDHVEITSYIGSDTVLVIPATINGLPVTAIRYGAFYERRNLTHIEIPESVTFIDERAFESCSSLTSIEIPESVTYIGNYAFVRCYDLTGIHVDENNPNYSSDDRGVLFDKAKTLLIQAPGAIAGTYTIPDGVTSIGEQAFYSCSSLTSIKTPSSITSISEQAFDNCSSLVSIEIPESVTSIGKKAFSYCNTLTSIEIPESVTSIGEDAFVGCFGMTGIHVNENNPNYSSDDRGVLFDKTKTLLIKAPGAITDTYTIPDSVTSIGRCAFFGCASLTGIELPDGITSIGYSIFSGCTSLTDIELPDGITSIGASAFSTCYSLASIVIPGSVTHIGNRAFTLCRSLDTIYFNGDAPVFGEKVFEFVGATAYYPANNTTWYSVMMQDHGGSITWAVDEATLPDEPPAPTDPGNGMFTPDDVLTRGMFFYALWNYFGSPEPVSTENSFTDLDESAYYYDAVCWALENGITVGVSATQFAPDSQINRAQAITFIWRAFGSPEPAGDINPFSDVVPTAFYYKAVLWDLEHGYLSYMSSTTFGTDELCRYGHINWFPTDYPHTHRFSDVVFAPSCTRQGYTLYACPCGYDYTANYVDALGHNFVDGICTSCSEVDPNYQEISRPADPGNGMFAPDDEMTRSMFFYALWNYFGAPEPVSTENSFTDLDESAYYYDAVCWTLENGITTGMSDTQFGPDQYVYRSHAAVFLWRAFGSPEVSDTNPYIDLKHDDFFYDAALWASVWEGYMGPLDATHFGPYEKCLYGHINWVPAGHTHKFSSDVTSPTCTEGGYTTYTCFCGYSYTANHKDARGHSFVRGSCIYCGVTDPDYVAPEVPPFTDVPEGEWFYDSVNWAVENGITNGTSEGSFSPGDQCLRAHVVTFLWRANGCPEPTTTDNSFTDVKESDFFYKAVLWAVEKGITNGTSDTTFGSYDICNRAQVVTFLHRAMGSPAPADAEVAFTDVPAGAWYTAPVAWAVENGITNGLTATEFGPDASCNRAQVVTFLYRAYS